MIFRNGLMTCDTDRMAAPTVPPEHEGWWDGRLWPDDVDGSSPARRTRATFTGPSKTRAARVIALSPLLTTAALQIAALGAYRSAMTGPEILIDPTSVPGIAIGLAAAAATLLVTAITTTVLAHRDWRSLADRGAQRLFPWSWGLLSGPYLIGRAIVLRRQATRTAGPAVTWLITATACAALIYAEYAACTAIAMQYTITGIAFQTDADSKPISAPIASRK